MFQVLQDRVHMINQVNYKDQSIALDKDLIQPWNSLQVQEPINKIQQQSKGQLLDTLLEKKRERCLKNWINSQDQELIKINLNLRDLSLVLELVVALS